MKFLLKTETNSSRFMELHEVDIMYTYESSKGVDLSCGRVELYSPDHLSFYGFVVMNERDWDTAANSSESYMNLRKGVFFEDEDEYLKWFNETS